MTKKNKELMREKKRLEGELAKSIGPGEDGEQMAAVRTQLNAS